MKITESRLRAIIQECITEAMFHVQQSEKVRLRNEKYDRIKNNICDAIMGVVSEEFGSPIIRRESLMFAIDPILTLISRGENKMMKRQ